MSSSESSRVIVKNLPNKMNKDELKDHFSKFEQVI